MSFILLFLVSHRHLVVFTLSAHRATSYIDQLSIRIRTYWVSNLDSLSVASNKAIHVYCLAPEVTPWRVNGPASTSDWWNRAYIRELLLSRSIEDDVRYETLIV